MHWNFQLLWPSRKYAMICLVEIGRFRYLKKSKHQLSVVSCQLSVSTGHLLVYHSLSAQSIFLPFYCQRGS